MCQVTEVVTNAQKNTAGEKDLKNDVSKWLKWKLGRRPGHRSIWTVFVSDGYDLFPSFRLWWR